MVDAISLDRAYLGLRELPWEGHDATDVRGCFIIKRCHPASSYVPAPCKAIQLIKFVAIKSLSVTADGDAPVLVIVEIGLSGSA